ncbi:RNA polymerase sigma factor [Parapedobacter tibetensis]|uniref:RNA polymerase sigma factor n=1 Tax=Parapedobacter tibetensis TaxID=2972951 RepID=UPI00214DD2B3|nr:sigma-70 family RNA polymerase sigma factor [Parapedobacter tibetensis]
MIDIQWSLFLSGDKTAFEYIYRMLLPPLYEYGMRKVGDEALVRDAIQDIFEQLWEGRGKLSQISRPKHYLMVALKNRLLNAQLKEGKLSPITYKEEFALQFNLENQIIKNEEDNRRAQQIIRALDQLTPKQREVIYLRYFEELSYEEIATLTNISVKSLYKLNHRAIESLKEFLSMPKADIVLLLTFVKMLYSNY